MRVCFTDESVYEPQEVLYNNIAGLIGNVIFNAEGNAVKQPFQNERKLHQIFFNVILPS